MQDTRDFGFGLFLPENFTGNLKPIPPPSGAHGSKTRFTRKFQGLDYRLAGVEPSKVIKGILT